ncbi:MAG: hypothetical protein BZY88_08080 [SAR202 cluster bacterium Io17-Chloro-G9]|nr:MAG: hypothetical protein BZY88_08080 [SAR202 cluster bacterium Io17-Chloro-G9]
MSRRKDQERFRRLKEANPGYAGFRGVDTVTAKEAPSLESVECSVCGRRRNVPADSLPEDRNDYVCLRCQEAQSPESAGAAV